LAGPVTQSETWRTGIGTPADVLYQKTHEELQSLVEKCPEAGTTPRGDAERKIKTWTTAAAKHPPPPNQMESMEAKATAMRARIILLDRHDQRKRFNSNNVRRRGFCILGAGWHFCAQWACTACLPGCCVDVYSHPTPAMQAAAKAQQQPQQQQGMVATASDAHAPRQPAREPLAQPPNNAFQTFEVR
jgi:hypothetical protein